MMTMMVVMMTMMMMMVMMTMMMVVMMVTMMMMVMMMAVVLMIVMIRVHLMRKKGLERVRFRMRSSPHQVEIRVGMAYLEMMIEWEVNHRKSR